MPPGIKAYEDTENGHWQTNNDSCKKKKNQLLCNFLFCVVLFLMTKRNMRIVCVARIKIKKLQKLPILSLV